MSGTCERFELVHPRGRTLHLFGDGAITAGAAELADRLSGRRMFIVSARPILDLHAAALAPLRERASESEIVEIPDGEVAKTLTEAGRLWERLLAAGGKRDACLVAFGGGTVSDLAGFVAGGFLRGVDWIGLPTTLLAQVDAAIGGKTGVDLPAAKNAVGLFHHPLAVLADPSPLATLAPAEWRSGLVETIKTAAVLDRELFEHLERDLDRLLAGELGIAAPMIGRAARAKATLVATDPEESGARQLLNFGHTLGHAIEAEVGYGGIAHGDAVAHGLRFALTLSRRRGCDESFAARCERLLDRLAVPPLPPLSPAALLRRLRHDKKSRAGGLGWVLLGETGRGEYGVRIAEEAVADALEERFGRRGAGSL